MSYSPLKSKPSYYTLDGSLDPVQGSFPSNQLSETAPLLPLPNRPSSHDHPIFLRVCHSPWPFLNQKTLFCVRIVIAFYLTTILGLSVWYEIAYAQRGKLWGFDPGNVGLVVQGVYYWISAVSQL